jgi:acyl-CoA thioester hydrolase
LNVNLLDMFANVKIRVRFNETDSMNYVYHGNYAAYYHASRTELLRKLDLSDKVLGEQNYLLPVISLESKFKKPVFYDDLIEVKTSLQRVSTCKLSFLHEVFNEQMELVNIGKTSLAFVDATSRKPLRIPDEMLKVFSSIICSPLDCNS